MEPLAGSGKDGVGDRGSVEADSSFSQTMRTGMTFDEPCFQPRRLKETQNAAIIEGLLFCCAIFDGDGFFEDGADREDACDGAPLGLMTCPQFQ
jgi:hypothetical protein